MGANLKKRFLAEINVTPFVDVMLVLLIIFMVTAPMMDQGLDVNLPQTQYVENLPSDSNNLVLTVDRDGAVYIDTYRITIDELIPRLTALHEERGSGLGLYLKADQSVPYGYVVDVMGRIKVAGISQLSIMANPLDDAGALPQFPGLDGGTDEIGGEATEFGLGVTE